MPLGIFVIGVKGLPQYAQMNQCVQVSECSKLRFCTVGLYRFMHPKNPRSYKIKVCYHHISFTTTRTTKCNHQPFPPLPTRKPLCRKLAPMHPKPNLRWHICSTVVLQNFCSIGLKRAKDGSPPLFLTWIKTHGMIVLWVRRLTTSQLRKQL
jgi:hypothetical protein